MNEKCSVYYVSNFIGKKWTILILLELYRGKSEWKRYSELKKRLLDIAPKILSARLKELVKRGLIEKRIVTEKPPIQCKYRLTKKGKDFIFVIKQMKIWSLRWEKKNKVCDGKDCKNCEI